MPCQFNAARAVRYCPAAGLRRRCSKSAGGDEVKIGQHGIVVRRSPRARLIRGLMVAQRPWLISVDVPGLRPLSPRHQCRAGKRVIKGTFLALVPVGIVLALHWQARVILVYQAGETGFLELFDRRLAGIAVEIASDQYGGGFGISGQCLEPDHDSVGAEGPLPVVAALPVALILFSGRCMPEGF